MSGGRYRGPSTAEYRALAEFRYLIRRFLAFSEGAARKAGLSPQQHQLLLAVKGLPAGMKPTIRVLAERLQLRHHSTVELADRMEEQGLLRRARDGTDRRAVHLEVTRRGEALLARLSLAHRAELRARLPEKLAALAALAGHEARESIGTEGGRVRRRS